jgi:YVTN family beta-propeller protein
VRPTAVTSPIDNVVFVSNFGSNTVSAIDAWTNKELAEIPVGLGPRTITADTDQIERFVFVPNEASDSVSIIHGRNITLYKTISVGNQPNGIAVNPIMNRVYTSNHGNGSISAIDYLSASPQREVKIAPNLNDIAVDPVNNILFVTSETEGLYVINGSNYNIFNTINLRYPRIIDIDPELQTVFITSPAIKGVYSYDFKKDETNIIQLGYEPAAVVVDSINHRLFVSGGRTNQIQVINETSKNLMMRLEFNVNSTQGSISCDGDEITNNTFYFYDVDSQLNCKAEPKTDFSFSSWSGTMVPEEDYKDPNISLNLTENGSLSPHFERNDSLFSMLEKQSEQIRNSLIGGLILGPIAGWFVGYVYVRIEKKRQLKYLKIYLQLVDETYQKFQKDKEECIKFLEEKRNEIVTLLKSGIINDSTFGILKDRIGDHFSNLTKR